MRTERAATESDSATLTIRLFDPGMSLLHRAGLGGLACTLKFIEREYLETGSLEDRDVPGGPWTDGLPPWTIEPRHVELRFGQPKAAGGFLRRLFSLGFQVTKGDKLIYLPGQFNSRPSDEVLAAIQNGLTVTFLQHGRVRGLAKSPTTVSFDPEGDGRTVTIEYKRCEWYKHQEGWKSLVDDSGQLDQGLVEVIGPLSPGAVVRHVAFTSATKIEDPPERALPLYFAIVGCVVLSINRGSGVLLVPDVRDLNDFCIARPWMTPSTGKECQIASGGDAALQVQSRLRRKTQQSVSDSSEPVSEAPRSHLTRAHQLKREQHLVRARIAVRAKDLVAIHNLPACHTSTFRPTTWSTQQKSRVDTLIVPPGLDDRLNRFDVAWKLLAPRVRTTKVKEKVGKGRKATTIEREQHFLADSLVRPLVADNLARDRPWYEDFVRFFRKVDPVNKKPLWQRLFFEKEGLFQMTQSAVMWSDQGEKAVVRAVHEALRRRFGAIAKENEGKPGTMKNRMSGEFDRWRLAFAGAKTADQFRQAICDLFARSGMNDVLRGEWEAILPWVADTGRWSLTRDLALLGLASYPKRKGENLGDEPPREDLEPAT